MTKYRFRKLKSHRHQHSRPYNAVKTSNILSYNMKLRRPEPFQFLFINMIPDTGNVINKSIKPHIDHLIFILRKHYAPRDRTSGNTDILKPSLDDIDYLILPDLRLNKFRMGFNMCKQLISVSRKLEKIVFFLYPGRL